jgi:hypothetical protein
MYLKTELQTFDMKELNSKFDVILVEPPLEEYQRTMGVTNMQFWGWDQVRLWLYYTCIQGCGDGVRVVELDSEGILGGVGVGKNVPTPTLTAI